MAVKKRALAKTTKKRTVKLSFLASVSQKIRVVYGAVVGRARAFMKRRPHRSFRRTERRDYVRSLKLPGYWAFTNEVRRILWHRKWTYLMVVVLYAALAAILVGAASQEVYTQLSQTVRETSGDIFKGNWGNLGQAALLVATGAIGAYNDPLNQNQEVTSIVIVLIIWLTTVWLLRSQLAGNKPKLRDGLYNAGAPMLSTLLVMVVFIVQLLPVALAFIVFSTGIIADGGVEAMLFWIAAALLMTLSLYWVTSTFIALIVVTLPGMYPLKALRAAGDLVIGRRGRILLRVVWLLLTVIVTWGVIMIPLIIFDTWLKGAWPAASGFPIIPPALLVLSSFTIVWMASYVYLLYRKIVDDDAKPA